MADHEESYFLKYLFLIFVGFFASRHFSFNPRSRAAGRISGRQDKRLMDKHAADKRRPDSAYVTACCPREYTPPQVTDDQTQRQPAPTPLR